jgi:hypothetical protein
LNCNVITFHIKRFRQKIWGRRRAPWCRVTCAQEAQSSGLRRKRFFRVLF